MDGDDSAPCVVRRCELSRPAFECLQTQAVAVWPFSEISAGSVENVGMLELTPEFLELTPEFLTPEFQNGPLNSTEPTPEFHTQFLW